jgi:hypothetical protein
MNRKAYKASIYSTPVRQGAEAHLIGTWYALPMSSLFKPYTATANPNYSNSYDVSYLGTPDFESRFI